MTCFLMLQGFFDIIRFAILEFLPFAFVPIFYRAMIPAHSAVDFRFSAAFAHFADSAMFFVFITSFNCFNVSAKFAVSLTLRISVSVVVTLLELYHAGDDTLSYFSRFASFSMFVNRPVTSREKSSGVYEPVSGSAIVTL